MLNNLSTTQIGALTTTQVQGLTTTQLNGIGTTNLDALSARQAVQHADRRSLTATTIDKLTDRRQIGRADDHRGAGPRPRPSSTRIGTTNLDALSACQAEHHAGERPDHHRVRQADRDADLDADRDRDRQADAPGRSIS